MVLAIFSSIVLKASFSVPPLYSTAAVMSPPALAMKSGTTRIPLSWRILSASLVAGMLAASTMRVALMFRAFLLVMTSGRAPGIRMSTGSWNSASFGIVWAPG